MVKEMICVACPIGCPLEVEVSEKGEVVSVSGNTCKRGISYAQNEITDPKRSLTTTVRLSNGRHTVVPVKSAAPFPKGLMLEAMKVINKAELKAPVRIGDIAVKNILGTGIDIVVTNNDLGR